MAGICGVVALVEGVDCIALNRRLASGLRHRGPDGTHEWSGVGIAMSHLALHVQPVATPQPLRLADGRVCVIDGRVDDPVALLRALEMPPGTADPGDPACIAMAIERWGDEFWGHVDGDFAVATWDPVSRRLRLVRDRLGVRPLFTVRTRQWVAFSSEPEPLLALPGVAARIRDSSVAEVWTQLPFPRAAWSDAEGVVNALPPAHRVEVAADGAMVAGRYWRLAPREPLLLADERDYVQAFQDLFARAVAGATRGVETTALMLSGGIDSAAILAAARGFRQGSTPTGLLCISAVSGASLDDPGSRAESANIRALASGDPRALHFTVPVQGGTGEPVEAADAAEVAWTWRHPVDASLYIPSLASVVARRHGARVILSGVSGDLVTAAPQNYVGLLARGGHWRHAWREARAAARVHTYMAGARRPLHLFAHSSAAELQPVALRRWRLRRQGAAELAQLRRSGLSQDFISASGIEAMHAAGLEHRLDSLALPPEEQRCLVMAERLDDAFHGFNRVVARQGLEARDPWTHPAVVDFFLSLPVAWRARQGWTKYVVRRACEASLGAGVAWHSGKRHHGPLVTRQVVIDAAPYLSRYLEGMRPTLVRYLEDRVLDDARSLLGQPQGLSYPDANGINALVALAGWLERQGGSMDRP